MLLAHLRGEGVLVVSCHQEIAFPPLKAGQLCLRRSVMSENTFIIVPGVIVYT